MRSKHSLKVIAFYWLDDDDVGGNENDEKKGEASAGMRRNRAIVGDSIWARVVSEAVKNSKENLLLCIGVRTECLIVCWVLDDDVDQTLERLLWSMKVETEFHDIHFLCWTCCCHRHGGKFELDTVASKVEALQSWLFAIARSIIILVVANFEILDGIMTLKKRK